MLPVVKGVIAVRVMINYTVDADVAQRLVPEPFRPKLVKGRAIAGVCLIRMKEMRLKGMPRFMGLSSKNIAYRIAVEWDENGEKRQGVYVPRRDNSSLLNDLTGGRVFPGRNQDAYFHFEELGNRYLVDIISSDNTSLSIDAHVVNDLPPDSVFDSVADASTFLRGGSLGYTQNKNKLVGVEFRPENWEPRMLSPKTLRSSFFEDETLFPKDSIRFDNALVLENIEHEWHDNGDIRPCPAY
jgi:hypothetical protein